MSDKKLKNNIKEVLKFHRELMMCQIRNTMPDKEKTKKIKTLCRLLTEDGTYNFNIDTSDAEFFKQILEFASHVNG